MKFLKTLFCISGALTMVACGGGGSDSPAGPSNNLPVVSASVSSSDLFGLDSVSISVIASDIDGDSLSYTWSQVSPSSVNLDLSQVDSTGSLQLSIPDIVADTTFNLSLRVDDGKGASTKIVPLSVKLLPAFSVSVASTSLEVNEEESVEFDLLFNNPRGDVSVEFEMSPLLVDGEYSIDISQGDKVSLTVSDINKEASYPFVVVSTDSGSGAQARVEMSVLVFNTSLDVKLGKLKALEEDFNSLVDLPEERHLYAVLLELAYFDGLISSQDKENQSAKFSGLLDPLGVENLRWYIVGHLNNIDVSDESSLDEYLSNFDEAFRAYIAPVNELILEASSKLNAGVVPDMVLGEYSYDAENNIYSQFWRNPNFGTVYLGVMPDMVLGEPLFGSVYLDGSGWRFSNGFAFMKDIVFPENQLCNLLEEL